MKLVSLREGGDQVAATLGVRHLDSIGVPCQEFLELRAIEIGVRRSG